MVTLVNLHFVTHKKCSETYTEVVEDIFVSKINFKGIDQEIITKNVQELISRGVDLEISIKNDQSLRDLVEISLS